MKAAITEIVALMKALAGDSSMASVQINSDGRCILREGCSNTEHLSIDAFVKILADYAATGEI